MKSKAVSLNKSDELNLRLQYLEQWNAELIEAVQGILAIHGPVATVSESVKALNKARIALRQSGQTAINR